MPHDAPQQPPAVETDLASLLLALEDPATAIDPVAILFALHEFATGLRGIVTQHAPDLLSLVLSNSAKRSQGERRKVLARFREMLGAERYDAFLARWKSGS
jgi:hypothetical protein